MKRFEALAVTLQLPRAYNLQTGIVQLSAGFSAYDRERV